MILLIDDDDGVRAAAALVLERHGFDVVRARNGEEGLRYLHDGLRPSVIVLDLVMPVINGLRVLDALASDVRWADIPVIVTSGSIAIPVPPPHIRLDKPYDIASLLTAVRTQTRVSARER